MTRKIADCRDMPSETRCTLTISGDEDEVVRAAVQHAVDVHGHTYDEGLREMIRAGLRDETGPTGEGRFVQLIEFSTDRIEEYDRVEEEWAEAIGPARTARWGFIGSDRDRPGTYVQVVEFPSYEEAMLNSEHPATRALSDRLRKVHHAEPTFRNLEIHQSVEF